MPPKGLKGKDGLSEADRLVEAEAERLRQRADGLLTSSSSLLNAPQAPIPPALRRCDGSDIVKRNASRKKKYLFVFPGSFSVPPGAQIGHLEDLDTRNPSLYVQYPPHGRLKFKGTLCFPKNSLITVKGSHHVSKPVQVVDTFETLVVFSEWAWIGTAESNPGEVPTPLPPELRKSIDWPLSGDACDERKLDTSLKLEDRRKSAARLHKASSALKNAKVVHLSDSDASLSFKESDASAMDADDRPPASLPTRSNPVRRKRTVDYAKMFDSAEENSDAADSESQ